MKQYIILLLALLILPIVFAEDMSVVYYPMQSQLECNTSTGTSINTTLTLVNTNNYSVIATITTDNSYVYTVNLSVNETRRLPLVISLNKTLYDMSPTFVTINRSAPIELIYTLHIEYDADYHHSQIYPSIYYISVPPEVYLTVPIKNESTQGDDIIGEDLTWIDNNGTTTEVNMTNNLVAVNNTPINAVKINTTRFLYLAAGLIILVFIILLFLANKPKKKEDPIVTTPVDSEPVNKTVETPSEDQPTNFVEGSTKNEEEGS